jgi:zinc and cadmium transporter
VSTLGYTLVSVTLISLISLVGVVMLALKEASLQRLMTALIAFAAGTMLAASFLDLIPEALERVGDGHAYVLVGIIIFFLIERAIHWHHCTREHCVAPVGYLNLIGDAAHNFVDGVIIAAAFLTSFGVGAVASVAIAMHELPQELGDFAVLVHSGFAPRRAIWLNFLTALTAIAGGLGGYLFLSSIEGLVPYVVAVAAGGLIYVAVADLLPELHKERRLGRVAAHTGSLLLGIVLIIAFIQVAPHGSHAGHGHGKALLQESGEVASGNQPGHNKEKKPENLQERGGTNGEVPSDRPGHLHSLRNLPGDMPSGLSG